MQKLLTLISFLIVILSFTQANANSEKIYQKLLNDWSTIFPDGNRNAAGPRFFKYIVDQNLEYEEFIQFNKLYCAVSGSLIPPDIKPDEIFLTDTENDEKICGEYYRCMYASTPLAVGTCSTMWFMATPTPMYFR